MKNTFWILALLIAACGSSNSVSEPIEGSQIPGGAIVQDYPGIPGLQKVTVKSGEVMIGEGDFLNGLYHGSWTSYGTDGRLQSITTYYQGKKQGVQLVFDNVGYVKSKASFFNDQLNGEYLVFNRKVVVERRNYVSNQLEGLQQRFYTNGIKMEEKSYVDGKIDGIARWYDEMGNLSIEYEYNMGELIEN